MPFNAQIEASARRGVPSLNSSALANTQATQPSFTRPLSPSEFSEVPSEYSIKSSTNKYLQNRGRISSRTQRRLNNDNFKDNPLAVLNPKDLTPPGFNLSTPSFHFRQKYADPKFLNPPKMSLPSLKPKQPFVGRWLRKKLQVVPITRNILPNMESSLRDFLGTFVDLPFVSNEKGSDSYGNVTGADEAWEKLAGEVYPNIKEDYESDLDAILISSVRIEMHPTDESIQMLVFSLPNSFHRLVLHALCNYYKLNSYSRDESFGHRSVIVCQPGFSPTRGFDYELTWAFPEKSFFSYLFEL